ncbi:hypothetical protein EIP91_006974 [Steccherinum ochraceum]|uniref:Uncharacterized protein n=1 Tax=Steccherinum ochraceum TaxID=92696 RepID=A0A4R0RAL5_9APHY|nr:hypothetical protein EIP91_006974 [Steccherinum ochraceum]
MSVAPISTFPVSSAPFPSVATGAFPPAATGPVVSSFFNSSWPSPTPSWGQSSPTASSIPDSGVSSNGNISGSFSTNTSTELLWMEQTVNAAGYLAAIAWGIYLAITYKAIRNIMKNKNRTNLTWLPFVGSLFTTATISMCCFVNYNEQAWIDQRNYPNGSLFFLKEQQHIPVYVAAVAASLIVQTLSQGYLVYRCHALWNKLWVTVPVAIWAVADFGLSVGYTIMVADSRVNFHLGDFSNPINLSQSSIELAMAFNIVVTALLLWRVAFLAPKVPTSFPAHIRSKFVRADAILIESVLFLGIISLVYVCLFGEGSTGAQLFFPLIVQLEAISATLILVRVVQGWGWDADVINRTPTDYERFYSRGLVITSDAASEITVSETAANEKVGMHSPA